MREKAIEAAWKEREVLKKESAAAKMRASERLHNKLASMRLFCRFLWRKSIFNMLLISFIYPRYRYMCGLVPSHADLQCADVHEDSHAADSTPVSPSKSDSARRMSGRHIRASQRSSIVDSIPDENPATESNAFDFAMDDDQDNQLLREIEAYNINGDAHTLGDVCLCV